MVVASKRHRSRVGATPEAASLWIRLFVLLYISLEFSVALASAQPVQWIGGPSGIWIDPANWLPPQVPNENSDVMFDVPGQAAVVQLSGLGEKRARTVTVQNGGVRFAGGGPLRIDSNMTIGGVNQSPFFEIGSQTVVIVQGDLNAFSGESHIGSIGSFSHLDILGGLVIGDPEQQTAASFRVEGSSIASTGSTALEMGVISIASSGMLTATQGLNIGTNSALSGDGMVMADVTSSGLIAPGEPIGTLSVDGDFVQFATGELEIELQGNQADSLNVSGSATLGGTLRLVVPVVPDIGQQFGLINAGDQLIGEFGEILIPPAFGVGISVTTEGIARVDGAGDMDQSGMVDSEDIDDFVVALVNPMLYRDNFGISKSTVADFAEPYGVVDLFDVPGFEEALADAGVSVSIAALLNVPEPGYWVLATTALSWFIGIRWSIARKRFGR